MLSDWLSECVCLYLDPADPVNRCGITQNVRAVRAQVLCACMRKQKGCLCFSQLCPRRGTPRDANVTDCNAGKFSGGSGDLSRNSVGTVN